MPNKIRCLVILLAVFRCSAAHAQNVVLVANESVQASAITVADLRAIYTGGKTRFADGSPAVPVALKGGPVHEVFLKNYIAETPEEFRAQWRKLVFTGQGAMLRAFDSESAVIEYVAATPGAVGYVSRISPQDNVKPLSLKKR